MTMPHVDDEQKHYRNDNTEKPHLQIVYKNVGQSGIICIFIGVFDQIK